MGGLIPSIPFASSDLVFWGGFRLFCCSGHEIRRKTRLGAELWYATTISLEFVGVRKVLESRLPVLAILSVAPRVAYRSVG